MLDAKLQIQKEM